MVEIDSDGEIRAVCCILVCGDKKLNILSLLTGAMSDNNESEIFVFFLINLKGNQSGSP
jgi:hypothetical protein